MNELPEEIREAREWRAVHDGINKDAEDRHLTDIDAFVIWKLGLAAWEANKKYGARFPHE